MYLFKHVVFNCRRATLLSLKKEQSKISVFERVELAYHLLYCDPCRRFLAQSRQLRRMTVELKQDEEFSPFPLPATAKKRIQQALDEG